MQVRFTVAPQILGGEESGLGEEQPEATKDLGVKMKKLAQSVSEKMPDGQISSVHFLLATSGTKLAWSAGATCGAGPFGAGRRWGRHGGLFLRHTRAGRTSADKVNDFQFVYVFKCGCLPLR